MKARDLPAGHVVRQVSGEELLHNVTKPLPLRIIGGDFDDIPEHRRNSLKHERNPTPHNGIAKILFAGDLEASRTKQLSHHHEELEKELLAIGEHLNLRGKEIDALNHGTLKAEQEEIAASAIDQLKGMTMTVIDGDFDREVVAKDNVYFTGFEMNPGRNTPQRYNARTFGPTEEIADAVSAMANAAPAPAVAVTHPEHGRLILQDSAGATSNRTRIIVVGLLVTGSFLVVLLLRRNKGNVAGLILLASLCSTSLAQEPDAVSSNVQTVLEELHAGTDRDAAFSRLPTLPESAVDELLAVALNPERIEQRGWAIVCLSRIGSEPAQQALGKMAYDGTQQPLVRTWAAAALAVQSSDIGELTKLAQ